MRNVLPGVVTTIGDIDVDRAKEINRAGVAGHVKQQIKRCLDDMIPGRVNHQTLGLVINQLLHGMVSRDVIKSYKLGDIQVGPSKPFREVSCLKPTTQPGDALVVEVVQPDGTVLEEYRGIVISSDGQGNGVVFQKPGDEGETGVVRVECQVQPQFPLEYISIVVESEG